MFDFFSSPFPNPHPSNRPPTERTTVVSILIAACFVASAACIPAEVEDDGIEIAGTWSSDWGTIHEIDDKVWDDASIVEFDNAARFAIVLQPDDAAGNPGTYSQLVWTPGEDGAFWYCTASFGKDSADEARQGESPDSSDPANGGCGGYPWDRLTPRDPIAVKGKWSGEFGDETITSRRWAFTHIADYDNDSRTAILQNPEDAEFGPNEFSRVVWTLVDETSIAYCYETFGHETADEAREAPATADASDLDEGCGGFSWTVLTRKVTE